MENRYKDMSDAQLNFVRATLLDVIVDASDKGGNIKRLLKSYDNVTSEVVKRNKERFHAEQERPKVSAYYEEFKKS